MQKLFTQSFSQRSEMIFLNIKTIKIKGCLGIFTNFYNTVLFVAPFCSMKSPDWHACFRIRVILSHLNLCNGILRTFKLVFNFLLSIGFGALVFRLFLLALNIFQAVLLCFVPIAGVFSCQKICKKGSPLVFTLKELNFADMAHFGVSVKCRLIVLRSFTKRLLRLVFPKNLEMWH